MVTGRMTAHLEAESRKWLEEHGRAELLGPL